MKLQQLNVFERFAHAETEAETALLQQELHQGGYASFCEILNELKVRFTAADEAGVAGLRALIAKGKRIVPDPAAISPAWERTWEKLERQLDFKEEALNSIPQHERDGEWQIVMDNPFTNESIVCYPALSFIEAAYLYAYFRVDLKKTEYIRLQKVVSLIIHQGTESLN